MGVARIHSCKHQGKFCQAAFLLAGALNLVFQVRLGTAPTISATEAEQSFNAKDIKAGICMK